MAANFYDNYGDLSNYGHCQHIFARCYSPRTLLIPPTEDCPSNNNNGNGMLLMGQFEHHHGVVPQPQHNNLQQQQNLQQSSPPALMETDMAGEEDADGQKQKRCRVCGDTATGYNFNVISCESCKAFFRRNALRPKEFKCPYSNDCEITAVSRRFCQKCRLQKCFAVGMKKEWILSEDQLRRRKNARIKGSNGHGTNTTMSSRCGANVPATPLMPTAATPISTTTDAQGTTAFSPSQQNMFQQHPSSQHVVPQQHSHQPQHRSPLSAFSTPSPQQQQHPVQLALNVLSNLSPQQQQASPGNTLLGINCSEGSPRGATGGMAAENKVSPSSSIQSPPNILPSIANGSVVVNGTSGEFLAQYQQQIAQQLALANNAQQRCTSVAQPQSQPSPVAATSSSGLSPLIEQCHRLMSLQSQQSQHSPLSLLAGTTATPLCSPNSASLLAATQQPATNAGVDANTVATSAANNNNHGGGLPSDIMPTSATAAAVMGAASANPALMAMMMDPQRQQELFKRHIQYTIQDELATSPPDTPRDGTPLIPPSPASLLLGNPTTSASSVAPQTPTTPSPSSVGCKDLRSFALNALEARDLEAVKVAFASMDEDMRAELTRNTKLKMTFAKPTQEATDIMGILDMVMRRFVKMTKKLPSFNELSHNGKFSLLKAAMIDMLTLRGAARLNSQTQCWKSPLLNNKEIGLNTSFFDHLNDKTQKNRLMGFYNELHERLKHDTVANNLVMLTVLFNHYTDTELSAEDKAIAAKYYENHKELLRKYLESVYGPEEARQIYDTVPAAFKSLNIVSEKAKGLFKGMISMAKDEQQMKLAAEIFPTEAEESGKAEESEDEENLEV